MPSQSPPKYKESDLRHLFAHHLNQLYHGKQYIQANLPHLAAIASFNDLQLALQELSSDIASQLNRLNDIYKITELVPANDECIPIQAIFKNTFILERKGVGQQLLGDLDIMLYMQLIEHINITAYRMLLILADELKFTDIKQMLIESFDESVDDDRLFMLIANEYLTTKRR